MLKPQSPEDQSFYSHYEYLKNTLYREVSGARSPGLLWPSYYYYWFYSPEKVNYTSLTKRQKLGRTIDDSEVSNYNTLRKQLLPQSAYTIKKRTAKTNEGIKYDDVLVTRENYHIPKMFAFGLFARYYLQLSRYWLGVCFLPAFTMFIYDKKFKPNEEYDNFLNYVIQKRNSDQLFEMNRKSIDEKINSSSELKQVVKELSSAGKSLEEAMSDLYRAYIVAAEKEVSGDARK